MHPVFWIVLIVLINAGLMALAVAARRAVGPRKRLGRLLLACIALLVLSLPGGACFGFLQGRSAVGGEPIDPSQKARILGETISEAMNFSALGFLSFFPPTIVAVALYFRAPRNRNDAA